MPEDAQGVTVIKGVTEEFQCRSCTRNNVRTIPLFPKSSSALTHTRKEEGDVCPYNSQCRAMQWLPHLSRTREIPAQPSHLLPAAWRQGGKPSTLLCSNFQHVLQWGTAHPEMQLSPQTHLWGKKTKKRKIFMEFAKRDVNFLRWTEAKLLIFWEINILEHAPPLAVFLCGPGLPGIQSGRIHILTCVKRALRKPSRRQEWDSTLVMFLCVPKNCCKPHRTG